MLVSPLGAAEPVVLEVYSDFQCPFCARLAAPIEQLRKAAGDKVKVEFIHSPLDFHKDAPLAHRAAIAAEQQGKFWEMHDLIFANPGQLKRDGLLLHAETLGLDIAKFTAALDAPATGQRLDADKKRGAAKAVNGTPTMFLNGKQHVGAKSFRDLRQLLAADAGVKLGGELAPASLAKGPANAPVRIDLFLDLTSPLSFAALDAVDELLALEDKSAYVVFRNLALSPAGVEIHSAVLAAAAQGRLWEFVQLLGIRQAPAERTRLLALAAELGLNAAQFSADLDGRMFELTLSDDLEEANRLEIRGSPAVVVQGKRLDGLPAPFELVAAVAAAHGPGAGK
ncbi:MAG: DsbA family protein [Acidobacteria bacterium]|nr:DsbA family protein [Acidobacteriota bacterium]